MRSPVFLRRKPYVERDSYIDFLAATVAYSSVDRAAHGASPPPNNTALGRENATKRENEAWPARGPSVRRLRTDGCRRNGDGRERFGQPRSASRNRQPADRAVHAMGWHSGRRVRGRGRRGRWSRRVRRQHRRPQHLSGRTCGRRLDVERQEGEVEPLVQLRVRGAEPLPAALFAWWEPVLRRAA